MLLLRRAARVARVRARPARGGQADLERPLTHALFLVGVYAAVHRLSIPPRWMAAIDGILFVLVALIALGCLRSFAIALHWSTTESLARTSELAAEFESLTK